MEKKNLTYRVILHRLLFTGLFTACGILAYAQQDSTADAQSANYYVTDADLPPEVAQRFKAMYPLAVNVSWIRNFNYFEVKYSLNSRSLISSYSSVGEWVKTEIIMKASELPPYVTQYMLEYDPEAVVISAKVDITPVGKIYQVSTSKKKEEVWLYYDIKGFFLKADVIML